MCEKLSEELKLLAGNLNRYGLRDFQKFLNEYSCKAKGLEKKADAWDEQVKKDMVMDGHS